MNKKFEAKKGQVLFVTEHKGCHFLSWRDLASPERQDWPGGDDKILLRNVSDFESAVMLIEVILSIFGAQTKNVSSKYPHCLLVVEIV